MDKIHLNPKDIIAVQIYLERKKSRIFVGKLWRELINQKLQFILEYDNKYLDNKYAISLGPELPLTKQIYYSSKLFPSFLDRIPSKENPAYKDYCQMMGIDESEEDSLILLSTIGKRGPSSFVFEPQYKDNFTADDLKKYREKLGLTMRDFSYLFGVSFAHLQRIESKKISGKEILHRIEIYKTFPEVALYELLRHGSKLHSKKIRHLLEFFQQHSVSS